MIDQNYRIIGLLRMVGRLGVGIIPLGLGAVCFSSSFDVLYA